MKTNYQTLTELQTTIDKVQQLAIADERKEVLQPQTRLPLLKYNRTDEKPDLPEPTSFEKEKAHSS